MFWWYIYYAVAIYFIEIVFFKQATVSLFFKSKVKSKEHLARIALFYIIPFTGITSAIYLIFKESYKIIKEKIKRFKDLPPL